MDLKDMILVTENDRGTEINMLMTLVDYKCFITIDDMSELADHLLQLGMDMYYAEQIVLGAEDMKEVDFAPISEGQLPSSLKENGGKAR